MGRLFRGISIFAVVMALSSQAYSLTHSQPANHKGHNFNVWFMVDTLDDDGSEPGMCNGSLIAKDLLITSAHCLLAATHRADSVSVKISQYRVINGKDKNSYLNLHIQSESINSKKFFFPKSIQQKIRSNKLKSKNINAHDDVALVLLERPVNTEKFYLETPQLVSPEEHRKIVADPDNYHFTALSTNMVTEPKEFRRYSEMTGMRFNLNFNKVYNLPMFNSTEYSEVEGTDSGAPILVNISGAWKIFAVTKGVLRDGLTNLVRNNSNLNFELFQSVNMYTPVAPRVCELLTQAGRSCN